MIEQAQPNTPKRIKRSFRISKQQSDLINEECAKRHVSFSDFARQQLLLKREAVQTWSHR
jgi:hypothetical protein